jgi:hypothetical protein
MDGTGIAHLFENVLAMYLDKDSQKDEIKTSSLSPPNGWSKSPCCK